MAKYNCIVNHRVWMSEQVLEDLKVKPAVGVTFVWNGFAYKIIAVRQGKVKAYQCEVYSKR